VSDKLIVLLAGFGNKLMLEANDNSSSPTVVCVIKLSIEKSQVYS